MELKIEESNLIEKHLEKLDDLDIAVIKFGENSYCSEEDFENSQGG